MILALDLDGVVQTGHAEGGRWDKHIEHDLGIKPEELQALFFKPYWRGLLLGESDLHETLEICWGSLKSDLRPSDFVEYWFTRDCTLDTSVISAVHAAREKGVRCILATNQEHHRARYLWNERALSQHFDEMLYSAALGAQKPDRAFFERAFERLAISSPAEIVFLDDTERHVEGARAAGWNARLYTGVKDLHAAIAELDAAS